MCSLERCGPIITGTLLVHIENIRKPSFSGPNGEPCNQDSTGKRLEFRRLLQSCGEGKRSRSELWLVNLRFTAGE